MRTFLALVVATVISVDAQEQKPRTKTEAFESTTGSVVLKSYAECGSTTGQYSTSVGITAVEVMDAGTGQKEQGIIIKVEERLRLERQNTSYIDYDEVDALLKGIAYIAKLDEKAGSLDTFQADLKTKDDLTITKFEDPQGKVMLAVKSGNIGGVTAYLKIDDLPFFAGSIEKAKARLDALRKPSPRK